MTWNLEQITASCCECWRRLHLGITIRQVHSVEDAGHCHDLAVRVWGEGAACSTAQLSVHGHYGGVLLLAWYDADPIGFLFSFPARYRGEFVLWSHETAVLPQYIHQGIGTMLKLRQRELAAEIGYQHIAWTFDPLISRNAYFNLQKLGARVVEYKVNAYGTDESDAINQGLETDRFIVVWETAPNDEPRETSGDLPRPPLIRVGADQAPLVEERVRGGSLTWLSQGWVIMEQDAPQVITEIPLSFESLLLNNRPLAETWRHTFRTMAEVLLEQGYQPVALTYDAERAQYIWTKAE